MESKTNQPHWYILATKWILLNQSHNACPQKYHIQLVSIKIWHLLMIHWHVLGEQERDWPHKCTHRHNTLCLIYMKSYFTTIFDLERTLIKVITETHRTH